MRRQGRRDVSIPRVTQRLSQVNVNGGAIALGHPLDMSLFRGVALRDLHSILRATGARQIATGLAELERRDQKVRLRAVPRSDDMLTSRAGLRRVQG